MQAKFFIALATITLFLSSCQFDECSSKKMYVASYDRFMKKVEKRQNDFTQKEWKELDEKFERFSGECFEKHREDLTTKERKRIMKYNFEYVLIRVKSEWPFELSQKDEDKVNEFLTEIEEGEWNDKARELKKKWNEMDKEKFRDAAREFGEGFEKLEKALEEMGRELKEVFEEEDKKLPKGEEL